MAAAPSPLPALRTPPSDLPSRPGLATGTRSPSGSGQVHLDTQAGPVVLSPLHCDPPKGTVGTEGGRGQAGLGKGPREAIWGLLQKGFGREGVKEESWAEPPHPRLTEPGAASRSQRGVRGPPSPWGASILDTMGGASPEKTGGWAQC